MIQQNAHKYSISAQCKCLGIARSTYYYETTGRIDDSKVAPQIQVAFYENRSVYGSRKIKIVLARRGFAVSRRRICRVMKENNLVSAYAKSRYKVNIGKCNEAAIPNELGRKFDNQKKHAVVVSDLTYVRVNHKWHYICILLDLFNREIIGCSAGARKDAQLVFDAFASVELDLGKIQMFHTDRGSEFNNLLIDDMLDTFQIRRSLSLKGCPYDNAVAESTFMIFKAEFVYGRNFPNLQALKLELADYVHWFNHFRIHSSLGYRSPIEFKQQTLTKLSD